MESGVEAGYLRQAWPRASDRSDPRQIVRLVQGCERDALVQPLLHRRRHHERAITIRAAVHNAVTDRREGAWVVCLDRVQQQSQGP